MTPAPSNAARKLDQDDATSGLRATAERFLRALHEPGTWFEIEALNCPERKGKPYKSTASAYHDDPAAAAADVATLDALGPAGVYVTLNPVIPAVASRAYRKITLGAKNTTANADVLRRRAFAIDIDPGQPSGVCATEDERKASIKLAVRIRDYLTERGWKVMFSTSPNGAHVVALVDLPNDKESGELLQRVLAVLGDKFDPLADAIPGEGYVAHPHVDRGIWDAKRVIRIPGTVGRKGDSTPERPHRRGELIDVPADLAVVPREFLEAEAAPKVTPRTASAPAPPTAGTVPGELYAPVTGEAKFYRVEPTVDGVRRYLDHFNVQIKKERDKGGYHHFFLASCPLSTVESPGNDTSISVSVGGDVIAYHNKHNRGGQLWPEFREHFEPGYLEHSQRMKDRAAAPAPAGIATTPGPATPASGRVLEVPKLEVKRAVDLALREFAPLKWLIPGVLPEGYAVLAGRPKLGKSYLVLNWLVAVAAGGYAMGELKCERRRVLYCALEDGERRLKKRIEEVAAGRPIPELLDYLVANQLPRFNAGGLEALDAYLREHPDVGIVVIDTYAKVRPPKPKNADPYQHDYDNGAALADLARRHGVSVVAVLHARKAQAEDFIDEITGTLGIAGAADVILVMRRARGAGDVELHVTGKDVAEQGLGLQFDPASKAWTISGTLSDVQQTREVREVLDAMKGGEALKPAQIAEVLGVKANTVSHRLRTMLDQGIPGLEEAGFGKYRYKPSYPSYSSFSPSVPTVPSSGGKWEHSEQLDEVIL